MKTLSVVIALLTLILSPLSFSQECQVKSKKDWEKVEIRTYKEVKEPKGYNFTGEAILIKAKANSLESLDPKFIREIKQDVAKYGACVVYVDFDNLMQVNSGLYYVWTDEGVTNEE